MTTRPPLWLLDVDGVLNAVTDSYDSETQKRETVDGWPIVYTPALVSRIADLHTSGRVEVRWLTTWRADALSLLAPALGLPAFADEGAADFNTVHRKWWKAITAQRLSDAEPDRALIWTDDDLDYAEESGDVAWLHKRTGPSLTVSPDTDRGLTAEHLDQIEAFIERATT